MSVRFTHACLAVGIAVGPFLACSSASVPAPASDSGRAMPDANTADDGPSSDASGGDAAAEDDATDGDGAGPAHETPGSCCQRDPGYDDTCSAGTPIAYRCFCPGGAGIPASCSITQGSLIVCCP